MLDIYFVRVAGVPFAAHSKKEAWETAQGFIGLGFVVTVERS